MPDEWDEKRTADFTKIFEQVSKLNVLRTIKRSTAAWLAIVQNDSLDEVDKGEDKQKKEKRDILVIRVGGNSTSGKTPPDNTHPSACSTCYRNVISRVVQARKWNFERGQKRSKIDEKSQF